MCDTGDEEGLAHLIRKLDEPLESIDWKEFHFFRPGNGLSKSDSLEIRICLDYEQARESRDVANVIAALDEDTSYEDKNISAREDLLNGALEMRARHVTITKERSIAALPADAAFSVIVPAVCVAASWFPASWLSASSEARRKVTEQVARVYDPRALPCWSFPMEPDEADRLTALARRGTKQTLHVIAIDHTRPITALVTAFEERLKRIGVSGNNSQRGKVKLASALRDLGCYRLARLSDRARSNAMVEAGFSRSANKISDAKMRTIRRLRSLDYWQK